MIREIAYNAVKDSLKTGDLILFHGVKTTSKLIVQQPELEQLKDFIDKVHDRGFPTAENALKYYIEGRSSNKPAPDTEVFCSELTAETFMALGFISTNYVPNGYCQDDFNKGDNMPSLQPFHFIDGARLNK